MAFSLVAWSEEIDTGGIPTNLTAVPDQHVTTDGYDVLVPSFAPNLAAVFGLGATMQDVQISSPTLRKSLIYDVSPVLSGTLMDSNAYPHNRFMNPIALTPGEGLRALASETGAGAQRQNVFVWLQSEFEDAPGGEIFTVKTTSATTLSPYEWSLCKMTFTQQLEAGQYAVVGLHAASANGLVARLVMPGSEYRPGVICADGVNDFRIDPFRYGKVGLFGTFEHTFPPQVEFFASAADTAETVYFDLIKL